MEQTQKNQCCKSRKLVVKHSFNFALERDESVGVEMVVGVAWARESHFEQLRFPLPTQITRKRMGKRGKRRGRGRSTEDLFGSGLFTYHRVEHTHTQKQTQLLFGELWPPSLGRDLVRQWVTSICSYSSRPMLQSLPCMHVYIQVCMSYIYINTHTHTYINIFSSYSALSTVRCPLSLSVHPLPG